MIRAEYFAELQRTGKEMSVLEIADRIGFRSVSAKLRNIIDDLLSSFRAERSDRAERKADQKFSIYGKRRKKSRREIIEGFLKRAAYKFGVPTAENTYFHCLDKKERDVFTVEEIQGVMDDMAKRHVHFAVVRLSAQRHLELANGQFYVDEEFLPSTHLINQEEAGKIASLKRRANSRRSAHWINVQKKKLADLQLAHDRFMATKGAAYDAKRLKLKKEIARLRRLLSMENAIWDDLDSRAPIDANAAKELGPVAPPTPASLAGLHNSKGPASEGRHIHPYSGEGLAIIEKIERRRRKSNV